MTQITARGWPGLINYKPPERDSARRPGLSRESSSLRNFDLWLVPYFKEGKGAVIAMSGSVELARIDLPDEAAIRAWCDPHATVKTQPYGLWRAYQPNVAIVGWDLGYTFGQIAEYWQTTRDGTYRVYPYGWGRRSEKGHTIGSISPHRPPLRMRPRDKGWKIWWDRPKSGPPGRYGKWVNGKLFTGNFIDLQSVEFALGCDPHTDWWDLNDCMFTAGLYVGCAQGSDLNAQKWFGGTLDTRTLSSPASLAKGLLQRIGVTPSLAQFTPNIGNDAMVQWVSHLSGGWLDCASEYIGKPTPVVPFDLRAAYALSWCLTDCWSVLTADHLKEVDVAAYVKWLTFQPQCALNPNIWKHLGCTLVEVLPDGEPWPVELGTLDRAYCPLTSRQPMWFPWQTVVAAAVLSGKTPKVLSATKLVPVGKQHLHNVEVLPGLKIRAHQDPVPALVRARAEHPELKWLIECLVWGIQAEFHKVGKTETPAPWCFPPIAATVAAGPRLLLALLDKMVRDAGGSVVYRDTDSSYVTGIDPGFAIEHAHRFLSLDQGWGVWKVDPPCNILVRDVKKYVTFDDNGSLLDWKESNLRGVYMDPPGHPAWTKDYHERIVKRELGLPVTAEVPTYLTAQTIQRIQTKPGTALNRVRPALYCEQQGPDSYLTRLRMWHRDRVEPDWTHINVTSVHYKGTAADAIKANREGRDIDRPDYGRTCPCGKLLPHPCRRDKVFCSPACKHRARRIRGVRLPDAG